MRSHTMSCSYPEGCSCGAGPLNELEAEVSRLNAELETAEAEREAYRLDLQEIGNIIGCGHISEGLARCVRDLVDTPKPDLEAMLERYRFFVGKLATNRSKNTGWYTAKCWASKDFWWAIGQDLKTEDEQKAFLFQ